MLAPPEPIRAPGVHPTAVVDPSAKLGNDVHVGPFTVIEKGAEIGDGAVIPQLGIVEVGDGVEIGSNTTIDRARIGRTYIGPMTKIDNLVQIGHNVKVKGYSGLIAQSGIAGSTEIGYGCLIWAQAGVSGHIKIADGVQVGPQAGVPQSLDGSVRYVIGTPAEPMKEFGGRVLVPKMLAKLKAEVKELKAKVAAK
jgi:UDP-3-O-[3-hydroxymyristoyl] glucosamine N-acyltransferase